MAIEINGPKTSDGKLIFLPAQFRGDVQVYFPGCGDDVATGVRHGGANFALQSTEVEEITFDFQFAEFVYFVGGIIRWHGAALGDWVSYEAIAPASPAASNPGAGAYAKQPVAPGLNVFVPGGGDWDLDLEAKASPNVRFTEVVPVPGPEEASPFDWSEDTDAVFLNMAGPVPKGSYNLFDGEISLANFLPKFQLLDTGVQEFIPASVKAKKMLPHWKHRVTLHNSTAKTLSVVWCLYAARLHAEPGMVVT